MGPCVRRDDGGEVAMTTSNSKFRTGSKEAPTEPFKRAVTSCLRGHADSIALKLACHDPKVHRKLMPGNPQARGVFEAVEQARVEAIGSRPVAGAAENPTPRAD